MNIMTIITYQICGVRIDLYGLIISSPLPVILKRTYILNNTRWPCDIYYTHTQTKEQRRSLRLPVPGNAILTWRTSAISWPSRWGLPIMASHSATKRNVRKQKKKIQEWQITISKRVYGCGNASVRFRNRWPLYRC